MASRRSSASTATAAKVMEAIAAAAPREAAAAAAEATTAAVAEGGGRGGNGTVPGATIRRPSGASLAGSHGAVRPAWGGTGNRKASLTPLTSSTSSASAATQATRLKNKQQRGRHGPTKSSGGAGSHVSEQRRRVTATAADPMLGAGEGGGVRGRKLSNSNTAVDTLAAGGGGDVGRVAREQIRELRAREADCRTALQMKDHALVQLRRQLAEKSALVDKVRGVQEERQRQQKGWQDTKEELRRLVRKLERNGINAVTLKKLDASETAALKAEMESLPVGLGRVVDDRLKAAMEGGERCKRQTESMLEETQELILLLSAGLNELQQGQGQEGQCISSTSSTSTSTSTSSSDGGAGAGGPQRRADSE